LTNRIFKGEEAQMKRKHLVRSFLFIALVAFVFSAAPSRVAQAVVQSTPDESTARFSDARPLADLLNPDGTLNTAAGGRGALDLRGWNVTLDSKRGPLFQPAGGPPAKPTGFVWSPLGTGMDYSVNAIAISGSDVYAGGWFSQAGGVAANNIAKWNGSSWSALGTGMDYWVNVIAVSGSDVYVGGPFTHAGGVEVNYIAKWNGSSWSALGTGMDNDVHAIAFSGSDVYAGGSFWQAGGVAANRIAKWNVSTNSWSALGTGMDYPVYAIALSGSDVYAGGIFSQAGGVAANNIAKWNVSTNRGLRRIVG
jgi:hypothetical protein